MSYLRSKAPITNKAISRRKLLNIPNHYFLVGLIFFGSRWITYVGQFPFYLTDFLLLFALFTDLKSRKTSKATQKTSLQHWLSFAVTGLLIVALFRLLFSVSSFQSLSELSRDFAPFAYIAVFYLARSTSLEPTEASRAYNFFKIMLVAHLMWTSASVLTGNLFGVFQNTLGLGAGIFSVRPDFDSALIAVLIGLSVIEVLTKFRWLPLFFVILGGATVFSMSTRAGLTSVFVALAVALFFTPTASIKQLSNKLGFLLFLICVNALSLPFLSQSASLQRLATTFGVFDPKNATSASADGTQQAREMVWQGIFEWLGQSWVHQLFGSGFGNNFLIQSGTLSFLEGTTYTGVRSPHNWLVGVYARLGLLGLLFALIILSLLIALALKGTNYNPGNEMLAIASITVLCLIPVSLLGVVLEAPFGAVLFFWAAGTLARGRPKTYRESTSSEVKVS